jgi:hypothetical protein
MGDPSRLSALNPDAAMRPLKWSSKEKAIARRAFDRALARELKTALRESKDLAAKIEEPSGLWELERFLTQRRKEIDRKYDFRYSVLPFVFANLFRDNRLTEDDLEGLPQDKLDLIRRIASI